MRDSYIPPAPRLRRTHSAPARVADINGLDEAGFAPLHHAVYRGARTVATIMYIFGTQLDRDVRTLEGNTPLHLAASSNAWESACTLLLGAFAPAGARHIPGGATVSVRNAEAATPLHLAAQHGHPGLVRLLLDHGAGADETLPNGLTPLHLAACSGSDAGGHVEAARHLLQRECNPQLTQTPYVDGKAEDGCTALYLATDCDNEAMVRLLLEYAAKVTEANNVGWTPLHRAAAQGSSAIVARLLAAAPQPRWWQTAATYRAFVNQRTQRGDSALDLATAYGHHDVRQQLLKRGATRT